MKTGFATYRKGKLYFNAEAWIIIKELARKTHKSPKTLIHAALRRYIERYK